jgi:hypothetical protein
MTIVAMTRRTTETDGPGHSLTTRPDVDRYARFQSLESGKYWRCRNSHKKDGIPKGRVLLLKSIKWVDDKPHTIILAGHPIHDAGCMEDGYAYLVSEFLKHFEPAVDGEKIRAAEMAEVQSGITLLNNDLANAADGAMDAHFADSASRLLPAPMPLADPGENQPSTTPPSSISDLIAAGRANASNLRAMRDRVTHAQTIATKKAKFIQERTESLNKQLAIVGNFAREMVLSALARTEDVQKYASKLLSGLATLDLYIGNGVDVETVCCGEGAPADEPLYIRQGKLYVEEEMAVYTDFDDGEFDHRNDKDFLEALRRYPQLRDQIIPFPRGVVLMQWRRHAKHVSDDPIVNFHANRPNLVAWLLVRNGDNLHLVQPPEQYSLVDALRLFPSKDEVDSLFRGFDGQNISFDDLQYTRSLEKHEHLALHYKRFLILLSGLQDRLALLGEFKGPRTAGWLLSKEAQAEVCRFLHDDERESLIGAGYPTMEEWASEANRHLRSGSRVLCYWPELLTHKTAPGGFSRSFYGSRDPTLMVDYKEKVSVAIAYKDGAELCVRLPVRQEVHRRGEDPHIREFQLRVSLSAANSRWDYGQLSYLCLDSVKADEISRYVHDRNERSEYKTFIRFFKAAHRHLVDVGRHEVPMRQALALSGLSAGAPTHAVHHAVDQAVMSWRASNRGAMLPVLEDPGYHRAMSAMGAQVRSLVGGQRSSWISYAETLATGEGRAPLRLVLGGNNRFFLYLTALLEEHRDVLYPHCYVQRLTIECKRRKFTIAGRRWTHLSEASPAETILHEWPEASAETVNHPPLTYEQIETYTAICQEWKTRLQALYRKRSVDEGRDMVAHWEFAWRDFMSKSRYVSDIEYFVPVGLIIYPSRGQGDLGKVKWIGVEVSCLSLIHKVVPTEAWSTARSSYAQMYRRNDIGEEHAASIEGMVEPTAWLTVRDLPAGRFGEEYTFVDSNMPIGTLGPLVIGDPEADEKDKLSDTKATAKKLKEYIDDQAAFAKDNGSLLKVKSRYYSAPKHVWLADGVYLGGKLMIRNNL